MGPVAPRDVKAWGPVKTTALLVLGVALPLGVFGWRFASRFRVAQDDRATASATASAAEDLSAEVADLRAAASVLAKASARIRERSSSPEPVTHRFTDAIYEQELAAETGACPRVEFGARPVGTPPRWAAVASRESPSGRTVVLLADPADGRIWRTEGDDVAELDAAIAAFASPPGPRWLAVE